MSGTAYNAAGRPSLAWRVAPHAASLARMRAALTADDQPAAVRALSQHSTDEPAIAVLDGWALVADIVSFYTERIANEGFLRTATELRSVGELAQTLGYQLRPGVAAYADVAFTVEDAPGAPTEVTVPQGTPIQTVPGPDQLPQTFETSAGLKAHSAWNAVPAAPSQKQQLVPGPTTVVWLAGTGFGLRAGDAVLVGDRSPPHGSGQRDVRTIAAVTEDLDGLVGWTRLEVSARVGFAGSQAGYHEDIQLHIFGTRAFLFGWNAPDPKLIRLPDGTTPAGSDGEWPGFQVLVNDWIELDGDHPQVVSDSWILLEDDSHSRLCQAKAVAPGAAARYALSGRITRIQMADNACLDGFKRRGTVLHCESRPLPAGRRPRTEPVSGDTLELVATDPPLPSGRLIVVTGYPPGTPRDPALSAAPLARPPLSDAAMVQSCVVDPSGTTMTVTLDRPLRQPYDPQTMRVLGNVVGATHGETVQQVLGAGDGRLAFAQFRTFRAPLTYLRATTPSGVRSSLEVRVDGVAWTEVESLADAQNDDRVFTVRLEDDGAARVAFGDGTHGARPTTGEENITATYRVGIGADGAADARQLSVLIRRPMGIREVSNPGPASDWAPRESVAQARRNAPLRVRTLDRAVSVADHEDFANGFAGVAAATATAVWNGQHDVLTVILLGTEGTTVSAELIADLHAALDAQRDPGMPLALLQAQLLWFGTRFELRHDPAYQRTAVEDAVRTQLRTEFGPGHWDIAEPVTAARVLVTARSVPGVIACTMPQLVLLPEWVPNRPGAVPTLPAADAAHGVLAALGARWEHDTIQPAQVLALAAGATEIGVMPP